MDQLTAFPESAGKEPIIAPDLQRLDRVGVWDLKHHPENVRVHNIEAIVESLRTYGQQTPIVVQRSTGHVCKGNGTLRAARDIIGWHSVAVSYEDFDDETARRYLLADNRTSDLSRNDDAALGNLLQRMADSQHGLQGTLFTQDDAEDIWANMGQVAAESHEFQGGYAETPEELAERIEKRTAGEHVAGNKEVVLLLTADEFETWALQIAKLSRAFGTGNVKDTVIEACNRVAATIVG